MKREIKRVFISGPITAATPYLMERNVRHAWEIARKLMKKGYAVYCPHLNSLNMGGSLHKDSEEDFERWIELDFAWLEVSHIIYMLKRWRTSRGAKREYRKAKELGLELMFEGGKK